MIRLMLTCCVVCFLAAHVVCQSIHPVLQIGKRGRNYDSPITRIQLDNSTRGSIYFRRDSTMPWEPVGGNAYFLRPVFYNHPLLAEDFHRFQKTRKKAALCTTVAAVSYVTFTISGLAAILSNLGEHPGGLTKAEPYNPAVHIAIGSFFVSIGCTVAAVNLKKSARLQLVNLINRYNESSLSLAPVPADKGWSLSIGYSDAGNSIGVGLRLRPN